MPKGGALSVFKCLKCPIEHNIIAKCDILSTCGNKLEH